MTLGGGRVKIQLDRPGARELGKPCQVRDELVQLLEWGSRKGPSAGFEPTARHHPRALRDFEVVGVRLHDEGIASDKDCVYGIRIRRCAGDR